MGKGSTWGSYYHHGRDRFGERLCSGILCLLCTGPILTIVGLYFLVGSATDTRTPAIHQYNDAVGRWVEGGGFATFQNGTTGTNVWLQVARYATGIQGPLAANTRETNQITDDRSEVRPRQYTNNQLRFTRSFALDFTSDCNWQNGCDVTSRDLEVFIGRATANSYVVRLPVIREEYRRHEDTDHECSSGDYWDDFRRQCVGYSILTRVCVRLVNTSRNGTWQVDDSRGGEGCGESAAFRPGIYSRLFVHTPSDLPRSRTITFEVRSVDDPRVQFFFIRGAGSALNFGLTQGEKFMIGAVLLSIGGLSTLAVFSCVCCICKGVSSATSSGGYQTMPAVPTATYAVAQPVYQQPVYQQPVYQQPGGYQPYQAPPAYGQPQQPVYQGQYPGGR